METTFTIYVTVIGDIEQAQNTSSVIVNKLDELFPQFIFQTGEEATTYDEHGDEIYNGDF